MDDVRIPMWLAVLLLDMVQDNPRATEELQKSIVIAKQNGICDRVQHLISSKDTSSIGKLILDIKENWDNLSPNAKELVQRVFDVAFIHEGEVIVIL